MDKYKFGEYLYNKRKQMGLSQEEVGYKLGVTNKAVSKWETGETLPDIQLITPLADILKVSCDDLLKQTDTPKSISTSSTIKTISIIVLSIALLSTSGVLIGKSIARKIATSRNTSQVITLTKGNLSSYYSISPCYKSSMINQTLTIYGEINPITSNHINDEASITLVFNIHMFYNTTSSTIKLYSYINKQYTYSLKDTKTEFIINVTPNELLTDYNTYSSFQLEYQIDDIKGELTKGANS